MTLFETPTQPNQPKLENNWETRNVPRKSERKHTCCFF